MIDVLRHSLISGAVVRDALTAFAKRRIALIARDGEIHAACDAGTATQAMLSEGWPAQPH